MKYCLYADPNWLIQSYGLDRSLTKPIHPDLLPEVMHSGLTNWARALNGVFDVPATIEEFEQYDVIHVNMTMKNVGLIKRLKHRMQWVENPPLIVCNPDYALEMWDNFQRLDLFIQDMKLADRLFCVESTMTDTLSTLTDKKVWHIPHPTNVTQLQELYGDKFETDPFPKPVVITVVHHYDQNYLLPTYAIMKVKEKHDFEAIMIGNLDGHKPFVRTVYDELYDAVPFDTMISMMSRATCVIDTAVTHSYGRVGVECRAVGTPCIGNHDIESITSVRNSIDILNVSNIVSSIEDCLEGSYDREMGSFDFSYISSAKKWEGMING